MPFMHVTLLAFRLSILLLITAALFSCAAPAHASQFGAILAGPGGGWLLFGCALVGLFLFAALCRQLSQYLTERTHASRVARVMDTLANQAEGIAGMLLAHPPVAGATLQIVREAAIAQTIAYVKVNMPTVLDQIGMSDGIMATRLGNFVSASLRQPSGLTLPSAQGAEAVQDVLAASPPQAAALPAA